MTDDVTPAAAPNSSSPSATAYWTPERQQLFAWMQRQDEPIADLYAGALVLLHATVLPCRARFLAHAVREIGNRLPEVLCGTRSMGRFETKNRLDAISRSWKKHQASNSTISEIVGTETPSNRSQTASIPHKLYREIQKLLADWEASRQTVPEQRKTLFLTLAPEHKSAPEPLGPVINQWAEITDYFMGLVHENGDGTSQIAMEELTAKFQLFERSLIALVGSFFKGLDVLDEILEDANS